MGLMGRLFGSESVVKKTVDGIYNGVDSLVHTDQEKAEYFIRMLGAYEPFKLAQRLLALIVGLPYVFVWLLSAGMFLTAVFMEPCLADSLCHSNSVQIGAKELAEWNNKTLGTPFSIILAFYFGGGAVEGIVQKYTERNNKK